MDRSLVPTVAKAQEYMFETMRWVAYNTCAGGYDKPGKSPIESFLKIARIFISNDLCAKDVYGAAEVVTNIGPIALFARNGNPYSSRAHLEKFSVRNLLAIAGNIRDSDREYLYPTLERLYDINPDMILSCDQLRDIVRAHTHSEFAFCLKGFSFLPKAEKNAGIELAKSKRPSPPYCPNNQAGCTEQVLLADAPYATLLQEELL